MSFVIFSLFVLLWIFKIFYNKIKTQGLQRSKQAFSFWGNTWLAPRMSAHSSPQNLGRGPGRSCGHDSQSHTRSWGRNEQFLCSVGPGASSAVTVSTWRDRWTEHEGSRSRLIVISSLWPWMGLLYSLNLFSHLQDNSLIAFWTLLVLPFFHYNQIKYIMKGSVYWTLTVCPGDNCYHCALFTCSSYLNPHDSPMRWLLSASLCHCGENCSTERLRKLPTATPAGQW